MHSYQAGFWESPISAEIVAAGALSFSDILIVDDTIYWLEQRSQERGRKVIVSYKNSIKQDITPSIDNSIFYNVNSKVHEYGGAPFCVFQEKIYFVNNDDQCIYVQTIGGQPQVLTKPGIRYANLVASKHGIICVAEEHSDVFIKNYIALIDYNSGSCSILLEGADFYGALTINSDLNLVAFISWNNPSMPWDDTQLWYAKFNGNFVGLTKLIDNAGESVLEPKFDNKDNLYFVSDRTDWWNIYTLSLVDKSITAVCARAGEFTTPPWVFGLSNYAICEDKIFAAYIKEGIGYLATIDLSSKTFFTLKNNFTDFNYVSYCAKLKKLIMLVGSFTVPDKLVALDCNKLLMEELATAPDGAITDEYLSAPQVISFPSLANPKSYALLYAPTNKHYKLAANEKPPLLVMCHGGPTARAKTNLSWRIQFWTSRGFAVVDVNYAGSTGFGRKYRKSLNQHFGIYDWQDVVSVVKYLKAKRQIDPQLVFIRGGSAGGYTSLCALTFSNEFKAGASYYGISSLFDLVETTHKFEAKYLENLVAPFPAKEKTYKQRSPILHKDKLVTPIIFFQGGQDKIVSPAQAKKLYDVLQTKKIRSELVIYPNEGHGFRSAKIIASSIAQELAFYQEFF